MSDSLKSDAPRRRASLASVCLAVSVAVAALWLLEPARAVLALLLSVWPIGYALRVAIWPGCSRSRLVRASTAIALGIANASLLAVALGATGLGLSRTSWISAIGVEFLVLTVLSRGRTIPRRSPSPSWGHGLSDSDGLMLVGAVVGALTLAVPLLIFVSKAPERSTSGATVQFFAASPTSAAESLAGASVGSVHPVELVVIRPADDQVKYAVAAFVNGKAVSKWTRVPASAKARVTVLVRLPSVGCPYRVDFALASRGGGDADRGLSFNGPTTSAKPCPPSASGSVLTRKVSSGFDFDAFDLGRSSA